MTDPKWYDMTISQDKMKFDKLTNILDELCERYVIGDEVGGMTGYEHWQCRIVLKKGRSWDNMKMDWCKYGNVSPSKARDFKYCEKEGIYFRSWEGALRDFANIKLLPWQVQLLDLYENESDRTIITVYDDRGNIGKSWFRKFLQVTHKGQYIPPLADYKDIMRMAMAKLGTGYVFDLPRADTIKAKKGMWMAIECIKDGYLFDERYQFREMWIKPPKILVFANEEPPWDSLSADRWQCYEIEHYENEPVLMPMERIEY